MPRGDVQKSLDLVGERSPMYFSPTLIESSSSSDATISASATQLLCYCITKPSLEGMSIHTPAHYFAVLTDGSARGYLYNAYGSELTKNPGYGLSIDMPSFYKFIKNAVTDADGYHKYFLANKISYLDDDFNRIESDGHDEFTEFVIEHPDLRIFLLNNYQTQVQTLLRTYIVEELKAKQSTSVSRAPADDSRAPFVSADDSRNHLQNHIRPEQPNTLRETRQQGATGKANGKSNGTPKGNGGRGAINPDGAEKKWDNARRSNLTF